MTIALSAALIIAVKDDGPRRSSGPERTTDAVPSVATTPAATAPSVVAGSESTAPTTTPPSRRQTVADDPPSVPATGSGRFAIAPAPRSIAGANGGSFTYTVEVEDTLAYEPAQVATTVDRTLSDPRGWEERTGRIFQRVADAAPTRVLLATPATVDRLCAPLRTNGQVSCRNGDLVVLNALRWAEGAPSYGDDIDGYRQYLINHEVGHRLGREHQNCPITGAQAPVMGQQTKGLQGCVKNPWP